MPLFFLLLFIDHSPFFGLCLKSKHLLKPFLKADIFENQIISHKAEIFKKWAS